MNTIDTVYFFSGKSVGCNAWFGVKSGLYLIGTYLIGIVSIGPEFEKSFLL